MRKLVIIHANCQGEPLEAFLRCVPGIKECCEVRLFTNYVREPVTDEALSRCEILLYQPLGSGWGELASKRLLEKLPNGARSLAFPSMFFKGYWPFWCHGSGIDYPDGFVDMLLARGLPPEEVHRLYCRSGVVRAHDLAAPMQLSLQRERIKEAQTAFPHVDEMLARFRESMCFNTFNHPGHELLCWLGRRILEHLGLDEPDEGVEAAMPELYPEFRLPIHPAVGDYFGLDFAEKDTRYPVYGRELTFGEYMAEYIVARVEGITDFIGFLRARASL